MADDSGLLIGLAEGIKSAYGAYNDERDRQMRIQNYMIDRKMKKTQMDIDAREKGLIIDDTGQAVPDTNPDSPYNLKLRMQQDKSEAFNLALMDKGQREWYLAKLKEQELERQRRMDDKKGNLIDAQTGQVVANTGLIGAKTETEKKQPGLVDAKIKATNRKGIGGPKAEKITDSQYQSGGYARRMESANETIESLENSGFEGGNIKDKFLGLLPGEHRSTQAQQFDRAKTDFITAVLRKESGASIAPSEFKNEEKKYFRQKGDSPEVVQQKKLARQQAIENLRVSSGGAYGKIQRVGGGASDGKSREEKLKRLKQLEGKP